MFPALPLEIWYYILERILVEFDWQDIPYRLSRCALVCRAWRYKAQQLIYRRFPVIRRGVLSPEMVHRMSHHICEIIPHLQYAIQELQIGTLWTNEPLPTNTVEVLPFVLAGIIPKLPALRHIIYTGDLWWCVPWRRHRLLSYHNLRFSNITSLMLDMVRIVTPGDLCWLLSPYPNLRVLAFFNVYCIGPRRRWCDVSWRTSKYQPHLPQIKRLRLALGAHPQTNPRVGLQSPHVLGISLLCVSDAHLTSRGLISGSNVWP